MSSTVFVTILMRKTFEKTNADIQKYFLGTLICTHTTHMCYLCNPGSWLTWVLKESQKCWMYLMEPTPYQRINNC